MKKFLSLMVVIFALAFNIQDTNAQQRPEEVAKKKVAEISQTLELTGEQQRTLWRALVKKESAYAKQIHNNDLSNPAVAAAKKDIDATYDKDLKEILTPEQYKKYKSSIEK